MGIAREQRKCESPNRDRGQRNVEGSRKHENAVKKLVALYAKTKT